MQPVKEHKARLRPCVCPYKIGNLRRADLPVSSQCHRQKSSPLVYVKVPVFLHVKILFHAGKRFPAHRLCKKVSAESFKRLCHSVYRASCNAHIAYTTDYRTELGISGQDLEKIKLHRIINAFAMPFPHQLSLHYQSVRQLKYFPRMTASPASK